MDNLENRRGVVILTTELTQDVTTEKWATLMRDIVIVHANRDYYTNAVNCICRSPQFRELADGEEALNYTFDPKTKKWNEVVTRDTL